jgi:hypothetical protein
MTRKQELGSCGRVTRYFHEKAAPVKPFFLVVPTIRPTGRVGEDRKGAPPLIEPIEPEMQISRVRVS